MSAFALAVAFPASLPAPPEGDPMLIHIPAPEENLQVDPEIEQIIFIEALTVALRRAFCIALPPSTLLCRPPGGDEPREDEEDEH